MTRRRGLRRLFRLERQVPVIGEDVDAEIATHLEMRYEELVAGGMGPDAARAEARRQFGDIDGARAAILALDEVQVSETRRREWWQGMVQDARHGLRLLRRSPAFTAVAIATLALGIGASAAIFSVVHQVLLRPLPFADQDRLVRAWRARPEGGARPNFMSVPDFDDWSRSQRTFVRIGAYSYRPGLSGVDLTGLGQPERLRAAQVTTGFFETLGIQPELGRLPSAAEMAEGGIRVAVVSDGLWHRRFGSDAAIIGRALVLDGTPHIVVGVMPPSMRFPGDGPDIWLPALYEAQNSTPWKDRATPWLNVIGRLAPGVTVDRARSDLVALQRHLSHDYPNADEGWTDARVVPLLDTLVGDVRPALLILFAAAGCVLLIASANIAALLLARATVREREFAVRGALGAPRGRIVQQVLTESLVLAFLGGVGGIVVAAILLPILVRLGAGELPRLAGGGLDWSVAAFTLGVAALSGIVLGVPPAMQLLSVSSRPALADTCGARGTTAGSRRMRSRQMLVVTEIGMAVVLVCGASLMAKSFRRLLATDTGFRPDHTLAIGFTIANYDRTDAQSARYYATILDRVREVPGVIGAGATKLLPLQGIEETWPFGISGEQVPPVSQRPTVTVNHISTDYFRTIGTPLIAGREFAPADSEGAPDVVIVNDVFARQYLPGALSDATHRMLVLGDTTNVRIVGIVRSVNEIGLDAPPTPAIYLATAQSMRGTVTLVARTRGDPVAMTGAIERAIWSVDKDQTINTVTTLDGVVDRAVSRPRLLSVLLACFASLGLLLGALGIYGVVAYAVNARRQEIGVRIALGANARTVLALVVGQGLALALGGVAIGLAASLVATRLMRTVLFGIAPTDPVTYGEVIAVLIAVAVLAAYLPARRATRIDATEALRGT